MTLSLKKYPISLIALSLYLSFASVVASNNNSSSVAEDDNSVSQTSRQPSYQKTFANEHEFLKYFLCELSTRFSGHHEKFPRTSIIYSSKKEDYAPVKDLYKDLVSSGIPSNKIWFDPRANPPGQGTFILDYIKETVNAAIVIFVGSPSLKLKYKQSIGEADEFLAQEVKGILAKIKNSEGRKGIIPIWFNGTIESCFPKAIRALCTRDLSHDYHKNFFNLLQDIVLCIPHLKISVGYIEDQQKKFEDERKQCEHKSQRSSRITDYITIFALPDKNTGFLASKVPNQEYTYLDFLKKNLESQNSILIYSSAPFKKLTISGLGGIGKTQLALAYVYQALENKTYSNIYWFQLNRELDAQINKDNLKRQYAEVLGLKGKITDNVINLFKQELQKGPKKSLIIYDDVTSCEDMREVSPQTNCHLLYTSRDSHGWRPQEN